MADDKKNKQPFRNEDTIVRRAWIESALDGVRARLKSASPETDNAVVIKSPEEVGADVLDEAVGQPEAAPQAAATDTASRPRLYVAWSAPARRSGT